ncbi:MAG: hemerythrin family protein [Lachnospiraceae bacterium]
MYEMKDEYLTGIELIDREHKKLFEIAEKIYQLQIEEFVPDKYDNIREILGELRDYTMMHFSHEEEYMKSINYKKMFNQLVQHDAFRKQILEWDIEAIDENQDETITRILQIVTDWLVHHILEEDKQIGK